VKKTLEIYVQYGNVDAESLRQRMPFAVEVRDTDLVILAETSVNSGEPAFVHLDDNVDIVFVYLIWPSGKKERQKAELSDAVTRVFFGGPISRNEWAAWAVPRLGAATAAPQADGRRISFFSDAWMQIWRYEVQSNRWLARPVHFNEARRGEGDSTLMVQLDLDAAPHMLQVGGTALPTKLFSLPAPGPCRVLLTPNLSKDPRADPLKVAVTGDRSAAESLIEYLVRDDVASVRAFTDEMSVAKELFAERREDPLAGVVGAYVYLRCGHWRDVKVSWFHNLYMVSRDTGVCADAALVFGTVQLRRGELNREAWEPWIDLIKDSVTKGMPVFAEAHALLRECAVAMSRMEGAVNQELLHFMRTLVAAQAWAGGMFSYYGMSPAAPTPEKVWNVRAKAGLMPQLSRPPERMPTSTELRRGHALRDSSSEGAALYRGPPAILTEDALIPMTSLPDQFVAAGTQHAFGIASASAGIPVCVSEDGSETYLADIGPESRSRPFSV